jgi:hypothetical protein
MANIAPGGPALTGLDSFAVLMSSYYTHQHPSDAAQTEDIRLPGAFYGASQDAMVTSSSW